MKGGTTANRDLELGTRGTTKEPDNLSLKMKLLTVFAGHTSSRVSEWMHSSDSLVWPGDDVRPGVLLNRALMNGTYEF